MFTLPHNPQVFRQRLLMETYQSGLTTSLQPYWCFQPRQYCRYRGTSWQSEDKVKMQSLLNVPAQQLYFSDYITCWGQLLHQNPPPLLRSWVAVPISWLLGLRVGENISNKIIIKILFQARYKKSHLMRNNKLHHYLLQKQWYYQIDSSHSTNVCNNNINEIEITAGWLSGDMWTLRAVFLLRINFINFYLIIITSITSKYLCNYY